MRTVIYACLIGLFSISCVVGCSVSEGEHSAIPYDRIIDREWAPGYVMIERDADGVISIYPKGEADLKAGTPISKKTLFNLGSVSKQFTAFAAFLLVSDGVLSLDDDVRPLVPYLSSYPELITVGDLVYHTSGIKDVWFALPLIGVSESDGLYPDTMRGWTRRFAATDFPPGSRFQYSNSGYLALADVVSSVSGQSFDDFLQERIFDPLGMTDTLVPTKVGQEVPNRAIGYTTERMANGIWTAVPFGYTGFGPSGVWTNATDLALWMDNLAKPIDQHSEAMHLLFEQGSLRDGRRVPYAGGLRLFSFDGRDAVGHGGMDQEFVSGLVFQQNTGEAVGVLSNLGTSGEGLLREITEKPLERRARLPFSIEAPMPGKAMIGAPLEGVYLSDQKLAIVYERTKVDRARIGQHGDLTDVSVLPNGFVSIGDDRAPLAKFVSSQGETGHQLYKTPSFDGVAATVFEYDGPILSSEEIAPDLAGVYYSEVFESAIKIEIDDGMAQISHFRSGKPTNLQALGRGTFHFSLGTEAYSEDYTLSAIVESNEIVGVLISNPAITEMRFEKMFKASRDR